MQLLLKEQSNRSIKEVRSIIINILYTNKVRGSFLIR